MNEKIFKALGNKHRLEIINLIKDNEICACMLLEELEISQPTLSHHMKVLEDIALVNSRKDGKWRHYSLNQEKIKDLANFLTSLISSDEIISLCDCKGD